MFLSALAAAAVISTSYAPAPAAAPVAPPAELAVLVDCQVSGANLTDTAYSLSSVMKAFNYPANQAGQAMADLNAIGGSGAMTFEQFNASIKNWAPTADTMGISLNSIM